MIAITKEACCSHGASKVRAAAIPTSVRLLLEPQTTANVLLFRCSSEAAACSCSLSAKE